MQGANLRGLRNVLSRTASDNIVLNIALVVLPQHLLRFFIFSTYYKGEKR